MRKLCFLLAFCSLLMFAGCSAKVSEPPQQTVHSFTVERLEAKPDGAKAADLGKVKLPDGSNMLQTSMGAVAFGKKLATNLHAKKLYPQHSLASVTQATGDGSGQFTFSVSPENTASDDKSVLSIVVTDKGKLTDAWVVES